ncbi:MAG: aminopeptidase P family protein [Nitrososphaerota archaeon]|nr:aminopeptidase P family protein [Nitrososphaerota archaeon]
MDNKLFNFRVRFPEDVANFLILDSVNVEYFTGFSGAVAFLVPRDGECVLYVSGTNFEQARHEVKNVRVELLRRGERLFDRVGCDVEVSVCAKLAVDVLSFEGWRFLVKVLGDDGCVVVLGDVVVGLRAVKLSEEVALIGEACRLADVGMGVACEVVGSGVSELEVAAEVEYAMRKRGSCGVAFNTIVVSGAVGAFPHGACGCRFIKEGDLVVVDLGAVVGGYRSDITRTFVVGRASGRQRKLFDVVREAQSLAIDAMHAGVGAANVDVLAREFIGDAGFGGYFVHNLGHGVGLAIHEAPVLGPVSADVLAVGNVVTVEPGIYIVGFGGIRVEDTVLVTDNGVKKLTKTPYTFELAKF